MKLKQLLAAYGGIITNIYIPGENLICVRNGNDYKTAIAIYGNYTVKYFDVAIDIVTGYLLNITLQK